ncbi:MAG: methyltransferase domain-containing protein [Anaerolineae bacterium]|nr:methyltransferase domain-containing protein [Anaerolineae bacterium]
MGDLIMLVVLALIALGIVALGYWLLIASEGVYLGRRTVVWLYDLYAGRYDDIKHYSKEYDHMLLAQPIMVDIAPIKNPLVLDVATGTARMPLALLRHAHFHGRVVGADLSRRMLSHAAYKLGGDRRASLVWTPAENLPFSDDTFDVVTCLEALEFMVDTRAVLREIARVLRPGGLLLTTNRINTRMMPGKTWTDDRMQAELEAVGIEQVEFEVWQVDYNRVWGRKAGKSQPTLARPLAEILRCPRCRQALLVEHGDGWGCPNCRFHAPVIADGVIEMVVH